MAFTAFKTHIQNTKTYIALSFASPPSAVPSTKMPHELMNDVFAAFKNFLLTTTNRTATIWMRSVKMVPLSNKCLPAKALMYFMR